MTAYELVYEKIQSTLICDNMVGLLLQQHNISAIVVGADRVTQNGDTGNYEKVLESYNIYQVEVFFKPTK